MALIKSNSSFFVSLMTLVALFGVSLGGTVHKVGDSKGWTMMDVDYKSWASSRTFKIRDSLVFEYNNWYHDVTEVTPKDFELCDSSMPLARHQTGSDTVNLTESGVYSFICGVLSHCQMGQKLQVLVLPANSLAPVEAVPVRSPSSPLSPLADSPANNGPQYHMEPSPAPAFISEHVQSPSSSSSPLADSPTNDAPQYHQMEPSPAPAPVPELVQSPNSPSSPSPANNAPQYHIEPSPAPLSAASACGLWMGFRFFPLFFLLILV